MSEVVFFLNIVSFRGAIFPIPSLPLGQQYLRFLPVLTDFVIYSLFFGSGGRQRMMPMPFLL